MNIQKQIVTSANWDSGRGGHPVTGIVLHTMVGYTAGAYQRFNDPSSQVSVHYGVSLDGSIHQWVEEINTAYQAGNYPVNQTTIGIEHEDADNANDSVRTEAEYDSSSDLVADICRRYSIPCDTNHIFLHKNVIDKAVYPGGTACPDGLDTNKIIQMAQAKLGGEPPMNKGDVYNYFRALFGKDPSEADYANWIGKPHKDFIYDKIIPEEKLLLINNGDLINFFPTFTGHAPTDADKQAWLTKQFKDFAYNKLLPEAKNRIK